MKNLIETIEEITDYRIKDEKRLRTATTHPDYERLEFLGDRVLNVVMAEWLFQVFPKENEGDLAKRHAYLVSASVLTKLAKEIDLRVKARNLTPSIYADSMEAVIGAIYLDGGNDPVQKWIKVLWADEIRKDKEPPRDCKTALQEKIQGDGLPLPIYHTIDSKGPDHNPVFTVEVRAAGKTATGKGKTKRIAEQAAARSLYAELTKND